MPLQLLVKQSDGRLLADLTPWCTSATISTNEHGTEAIDMTASMPAQIYALFDLYNRSDLVLEMNNGAEIIGEARLEDSNIHFRDGVFEAHGLGFWRAFSDIPYTALWSTTQVSEFTPITNDQVSNRTPERYTYDTNNRLWWAPQKGAAFVLNGTDFSYTYFGPHSASRSIVGVSFDYAFLFPDTGWTIRCVAHNPYDQSSVVINSWTASAATTVSGSAFFTFNGRQGIYFDCYRSGANATYSGETGAAYVRITNVRMVTSNTNAIQTTLTANATSGTNKTLAVASTERMFVGQQILIGATTSTMERCTITAINSTTSVTVASLAANKSSGALVRAHLITPDQVVSHISSIVSATNANQLKGAVIEPVLFDLTDRLYEDHDMGDILTDMARIGDGSRSYEIGVDTNRQLYFRPRYSRSSSWYALIDDLAIGRSLDRMYNSVYATFENANGIISRTAIATDAASVADFALTRRRMVQSDGTSSAQANTIRDAALSDTKRPAGRASMPIRTIYGEGMGTIPLWRVRAGDQITVMNIPSNVSRDINAIQTYRISRTVYDAINNTLEIEPEDPATTLDAVIAGRV